MVYLISKGARGDHVAAVRLQGGSLVAGNDCLPVFDWQGAILCTNAQRTEVLLRAEC